MKKISRISSFVVRLMLAYIVAFFIKIFDRTKRNVWIISERGDDARDNGWFFFEYMVKYHPEQTIYYIINSKSADFNKVKNAGNWIEYNSFKHFIYYALCKVRLSAHVWGGDLPYAAYFSKLQFLKDNRKKYILLKHGITKDYLPRLFYESTKADLFICGAAPEYKYVQNAFGYPDKNVKYTGFARFDNLHCICPKRQILIMPTFRLWLQKATPEDVALSEYVSTYQNILQDEHLAALLEEYEIDLIFYPHYVMQKYLYLFKSSCKWIHVAGIKDYDVQQLLIDSKLLITDYSSVFFDFGYMNKPVLYYQFDRERYIKEHYDFTKGYFSYDINGFGKVAFDHESIIQSIEKMIECNFVVEENYQARIDSFFEIKDDHNCDRIYEQIERLIKNV